MLADNWHLCVLHCVGHLEFGFKFKRCMHIWGNVRQLNFHSIHFIVYACKIAVHSFICALIAIPTYLCNTITTATIIIIIILGSIVRSIQNGNLFTHTYREQHSICKRWSMFKLANSIAKIAYDAKYSCVQFIFYTLYLLFHFEVNWLLCDKHDFDTYMGCVKIQFILQFTTRLQWDWE